MYVYMYICIWRDTTQLARDVYVYVLRVRLYWICIGLLWVASQEAGDNHKRCGPSQPKPRLGLPADDMAMRAHADPIAIHSNGNIFPPSNSSRVHIIQHIIFHIWYW